MSTVPDHCQFCDETPVAGLNDVPFCADHVNEGVAEVVRVLAVAKGIKDPQRIAAMTETFLAAYREADAAVDSEDMKPGDTFSVNTGYNPRLN